MKHAIISMGGKYIVGIHPQLCTGNNYIEKNRIFYLPIWAHMGKKKSSFINIGIEFLN
jgi:hypothetical protein